MISLDEASAASIWKKVIVSNDLGKVSDGRLKALDLLTELSSRGCRLSLNAKKISLRIARQRYCAVTERCHCQQGNLVHQLYSPSRPEAVSVLSPLRPCSSYKHMMGWPTSILRATRRPTSPVSFDFRTKLFTQQDDSKLFACAYCRRQFYSLGGQAGHISQTSCQFLERAQSAADRVKRTLEMNLNLASNSERAPMRVRFVDNDVTSVNQSAAQAQQTSETPNPLACTAPSTEHELPADRKPPSMCEMSPDTLSHPGAEPLTAGPRPRVLPHERLITHDGGQTYIESYPDPLAGSPINDTIAPQFDLHAYIQGTGSLSNLEHFNDLELLMTIGLTDQGCDRMLKSRAVSVLLD